MNIYTISQIVEYKSLLWRIEEVDMKPDGNIILSIKRGSYREKINSKEVKIWKNQIFIQGA